MFGMKVLLVFVCLIGIFFSALIDFKQPKINQQILQNGNFLASTCVKDECLFSFDTNRESVSNWYPTEEFILGYGQRYNRKLGKERVIIFSQNIRSCMTQYKWVEPGNYQLIYEYTAREQVSLNECQFKVQLTDQKNYMNQNKTKVTKIGVKKISPIDYSIHQDIIELNIKEWIFLQMKFCGISQPTKASGAIIKSVSLKRTGKLVDNLSNQEFFAPQLTVVTSVKKSARPLKPQDESSLIELVRGPISRKWSYFHIKASPRYQQDAPTPIRSQIIVDISNPDESGLILDVRKKCLRTKHQLQSGELEISFRYQKQSYQTQNFIVSFDGKQMYEVNVNTPNGNIVSFKAPGNVAKGIHTLEFCWKYNAQTQTLSGFNVVYPRIKIYNINLNQINSVKNKNTPQNLIKNGDFEQNSCDLIWCSWTQKTVGNRIPGWIPQPEVTIGKGKIYNDLFGYSWVAELIQKNNFCIKQKVVLEPGVYFLQFSLAATIDSTLVSNECEVRLDGETLQSFQLKDLKLNQKKLQFSFKKSTAEAQIQFCGKGDDQDEVVLIDNIKLFKIAKLPTEKISLNGKKK